METALRVGEELSDDRVHVDGTEEPIQFLETRRLGELARRWEHP
jgi:hypothetical protein